MKKAPAIILLIIGNLAAVFAVSLLIFHLVWNTGDLGLTIIVGLTVLAALGFASCLIYDKFKKRYGLKPSRFILAAYVPSVAVSVINFIIVSILDSLDYYDGFLGGLGEYLSSLFFAIPAVLYLIFGSGFTLSPAEEKDETKGTPTDEQQN